MVGMRDQQARQPWCLSRPAHTTHTWRAFAGPPPLPSFQRIQIEPFGSFFLLFSSLLPAGADLSLQLAELHPRGTCFAFVVHEIAINYWLLCVSQSPTQPIKLSGHDIALCTRLLLVSWHRPKGRVGAPGMCCSPV